MLDSIRRGQCAELKDQNGRDISRFMHGKYVAVLGIGTGIGHAIARIDSRGNPHFVTDGHASKLRIKVDDEDWPLIEKIISERGSLAVVDFPDHTVRAEDLFRGSTLHSLAFNFFKHIDPDHPLNQQVIRFAGKYMARTIEAVKSGESVDVYPSDGWSAADKAEAAKTSIYLIGGGIGSSRLGQKIIEAAKQELGKDNETIQLVQMPPTNVARGAALLVPPSLYHAGPATQR